LLHILDKVSQGILVYQRYKLQTLIQAKEYINYLLSSKAAVRPNEVEEFELDQEQNIERGEGEVGSELGEYLNSLEVRKESKVRCEV